MNTRILRLPDVMRLTGLGRSSLYAMISNNIFPKPCPLGVRSVGWLESEITDWIASRADLRGAK